MQLQHFGITVSDADASRKFYYKALKAPYVSSIHQRGPKREMILGVPDVECRIDWFQVGKGGFELFHFPKHPSRNHENRSIDQPGYKYIAFGVKRLEEYLADLRKRNVEVLSRVESPCPAAMIADPDGSYILFVEEDTVERGRAGLSSIREIGLVAGDMEGTSDFLKLIGLEERVGDPLDAGAVQSLLGMEDGISMRSFQGIRLIHCPGRTQRVKESFFPDRGQIRGGYFPDVGIKHVAYNLPDLVKIYRELLDKGVKFLFPIQDEAAGCKVVYLSDPDGNTIELMYLTRLAQLAMEWGGKVKRLVT